MQLRDAMLGNGSRAEEMAGDILIRAASGAMKDASIDTGDPNLDAALSAAGSSPHYMDIVMGRWGIMGVNYFGNLIEAGHVKDAALLVTLPTDARAVILAEEYMKTATLSGEALSAQLDAITQDLADPFTKKQALLQADSQAVSVLKADLLDQGAMADLTVFTQEAVKAQSGLQKAQADKGRALQTEQSARQAFVKAQAAFSSNPADASAMQAAMDASVRLTTAVDARKTADQAFTNSQKLLMDAEQKLDSAKALADAGLENQAKELLAQEREKRAGANGAGLGGQTVVQTEDQTGSPPGDMPIENMSIDSNPAENAADPLAPKDGSGIIKEGTQGEAGDGDARSDAQAEEVYDTFTLTPELENHIMYVDMSVPRKRGIGGAHNSEEFFKNDVSIMVSIPSTDIEGVTYYEYTMPLLGKDGNPIGGYGKSVFKKTVYDPKVFSHSEYMKRGLEAANDAYRKNNGVLDEYWEGYDSYGVKWVGFEEDGLPKSFFPYIPVP